MATLSRTLMGTVLLATTAPAQEAAGFLDWVEHLRPTEAETRWASIPWRQGFAEGLKAASREGKPLLLWVMNGHPLGCT